MYTCLIFMIQFRWFDLSARFYINVLLFYLAQAQSDAKYVETTDSGEEMDVNEEFAEVLNALLATGDTIQPKVLFTPNNSVTWSIIQRVSYYIKKENYFLKKRKRIF